MGPRTAKAAGCPVSGVANHASADLPRGDDGGRGGRFERGRWARNASKFLGSNRVSFDHPGRYGVVNWRVVLTGESESLAPESDLVR